MKKILFAALALTMLATVCLSQAAFAENFVEVDRTERNIAYIDTDSIKDNGGYLTAVTKIKKPAHHTHTGTSGRYWWSAMAAMMYMRSGVTRYWSRCV